MKTCQSCGRRPAEIEFIQQSGEIRREMALCRECALSVGMRAQVEAFQRISQLLMHQHGSFLNISEEMKTALTAKCSNCGLVFEEFVQTGLLGCPQCYRDFHEPLQAVLRRMHGVIKAVAPESAGTVETVDSAPEPVRAADLKQAREQMEMELHLALLEEDYEKAAALRDKLRDLG